MGLTVKPSSVTMWALSLHTRSHLRGDRLAMKDKQNNKTTIMTMKGASDRITGGTPDRVKIKEAFQNYVDSLATDTHPPGLLNVVTGLHATDKGNADESIKIERHGRI